VGAIFHPAAPGKGAMSKLPNSLAIGLWVVGTCWVLAVLGYLFGASSEWMVPLIGFGALTGVAEWYLRKQG
jgi:hypothetical protein